MIKVTTSQEKESKEIDYPCLMESDGLILECLDIHHYIVRVPHTGVFKTGDNNCVEDAPPFNLEGFTPYKGTITLQND